MWSSVMMNEWWKVSAEGLTAAWHCRSSCWTALTLIPCCFSLSVRLKEEWSGQQQAELVLSSCRGSMSASWCCLKRLYAHSSLSSSASWESLNTYSRSIGCLGPSKATTYRNFLVERVKESGTITKDVTGWAYWKNTTTLVLLKPDMNRVEQGLLDQTLKSRHMMMELDPRILTLQLKNRTSLWHPGL